MHFDGNHVLVRVGSQTDWEVPGDRPIQLAHHPAHPSGRKQTELLPQITYKVMLKIHVCVSKLYHYIQNPKWPF